MWPVIPPSLTATAIGAALALFFFSMRIVQPAWWRTRRARALVLVVFGGMLAGLALWAAGRFAHHLPTVHLGAGIAYVGVLVSLPAALVMPFAALADRLLVKAAPPAEASEAAPAPAITRRSLIRLGAASLPAIAAAGGGSGFATAQRAPTTPVLRLRFEGLHPDLEGLRILQLSDLHLGVYLGLDDLAEALKVAQARLKPDLIVLTGDLADDPSLIPEALRLVAAAGARHGALASLGNHEYLHDIAVTRPLYEASPVPLLVGAGRTIGIGGATLFVGGTDDPVHMEGDIAWLLDPSIRAAAAACPEHADFRLLLCHRPEGFAPAAAAGFDLTLSGHTHGGQIGLFGRSLLERLRPGTGWWGAYARPRPPELARTRGPLGPSRLYTTSGFGHWFPFRLGCPTEMPLIVLEGAPIRPRVLQS